MIIATVAVLVAGILCAAWLAKDDQATRRDGYRPDGLRPDESPEQDAGHIDQDR